MRVALPPDHILFNRVLLMDLMTLEGQLVLHMVDKDTSFSEAVFLSEGESTRDVWNAYSHRWANQYVGHPDEIHDDQGPQFQSSEWRNLLQTSGIKQTDSGNESHNALAAGETYHEYLRQIFRKVRTEHPGVSRQHALSLSVYVLNSTAGPSGLAPSLLVFGIVPRMPIRPAELPEQKERMRALQKARAEMMKHVARSRRSRARRSNVPASADSDIRVGMEVLFYRERPIHKWTGPFKVTAIDAKQVWIDVGDRISLVAIDKVKEYHSTLPEVEPQSGTDQSQAQPANEDALNVDELGVMLDQIISADTFFSKLGNALSELAGTGSDDNLTCGPTTVKVFLTEVLNQKDIRTFSPEFTKTKQTEINGLMKRGTFRAVNIANVPKNANVLGGRFVCTLENSGTDREHPKARFVAQGHKDKEKPFIVHNLSTLRQRYTKIIVSTAAVMNFRVFTHHVKQAYLQSKDRLTGTIYLKPKEGDRIFFSLKPHEVLRLEKPLYGVCDAGDYWGVTVISHVEDDLGMVPLAEDPSLYMKESAIDVDGLLGTYVYDCLLTGNTSYQNLTKELLQKFEPRQREWDNVEFLGVKIRTVNTGRLKSFEISQPEFLQRLQLIPNDASFEMFTSIRAAVAWLAHSRPDICCAINRAAQVTEKTYNPKHVKELNKAIQYVKTTADVVLKYEPFDRNALHLSVYADASFASNDDNSSQLGYFVFLCDSRYRCHVLAYSSRKSQRVVRSIMAGKVYAFTDGFDCAFMIKHELEAIYKQHIPITILTDSKQMFDVVTKATHTTEKRLMIDIAASIEAYERGEISNVGLVLSGDNVADGLTKPIYCKAMDNVLRTGFD